jgi:surface antigen
MIATAKGQIGYVETPSNITKYGKWYGANGEPWCDMFISWCASQAGGKDIVGKFAYTPDHAAWFKRRKQWGHTPKPGAIVFYNMGLGRISHVGLVIAVRPDGRIVTIEGNTSSGSGSQRNGGEVAMKVRSTNLVVGYGYPAYLPEPTPKPSAAPSWPRKAKIIRDTTLWNETHGTKRGVAGHGGMVSVSGLSSDKKWAHVSWGGHAGDVLYNDIKYV